MASDPETVEECFDRIRKAERLTNSEKWPLLLIAALPSQGEIKTLPLIRRLQAFSPGHCQRCWYDAIRGLKRKGIIRVNIADTDKNIGHIIDWDRL